MQKLKLISPVNRCFSFDLLNISKLISFKPAKSFFLNIYIFNGSDIIAKAYFYDGFYNLFFQENYKIRIDRKCIGRYLSSEE